MPTKQLRPCDPSPRNKKGKEMVCRWQFSGDCLAHPDLANVKKGYALYLPRKDVSEDECRKWFVPISPIASQDEKHNNRNPAKFVAQYNKKPRVKKKQDVGGSLL